MSRCSRIIIIHNLIANFLVSTLICSIIPPCVGYVNWIYPPSGSTALSYNYIDTVYFTWTSNYTNAYLGLWCTTSDKPVFIIPGPLYFPVPTNSTSAQSFPYSKYFNGTCHMEVFDPDPGAIPGTNSPDFVIAHIPTASAQTWGLYATSLAVFSPAATGTGSSIGSTVAQTSGLSSTSPAVSSPTTTRSVSSTAKTGTQTPGFGKNIQVIVGVLSVVGAVAVVTVALFYVGRRRKRKRERERENQVGRRRESERLEVHRPVRGEGTLHELRGREMLTELGGTMRVEL